MAGYKRTALARDAWICFEDEAGQNLKPPKARTRARSGHTPMLRVSGSGSGRISIAALVCLKSGQRTRLVYRIVLYHRRKGEKKGFAETGLTLDPPKPEPSADPAKPEVGCRG